MKKIFSILFFLPLFVAAQPYTSKQGDPRQLQIREDAFKFNGPVMLPHRDSANWYPGYRSDLYVQNADTSIRVTNPQTGYDYELTNYVTPDMFGVKANTGVDVSTGMQSAINYASAKNKVLFLGTGTYLVKNLTLPSRANISGQSFNTVLQLPSGSETDKQVFTINAGVSDVTLNSFIIDANRTGQSGSNVVCLKVINNDTAAANKISNLKFTGITFRNSRDRALTWFRGFRIENTTIENCVFTNAGVQAVELRGCKNFTFRNNTVTAWGLTTTAAPAFGLQSVINDGINITGNFFINTVGGQFAIESAGAYVQNSSVTSNTFDGNNQPAAGISGYFRNTTFSGNKHIRGVGTHRTGYELIGNDLVVSGNYLENGAIVFTADEVNPVAEVRPNGNNCIITNNIIKTNATNASSVYLSGFCRNDTIAWVSNVLVSGNLIDNRGSTGNSSTISVGFYGTAGLVNQVKILDNKIYGDASQSCIRMRTYDTSTNVRIADNEFLSGQYAVRIDQPTAWESVEISNNDISKLSLGEYVFGTGTFTSEFKVFNNIYGANKRAIKIDDKRTITTGSGSPEGVVPAEPGSVYFNTNGGAGVTMYIKEAGIGLATGWQAVAPATGFASLSANQTFTGTNTFNKQIKVDDDAGGMIWNSDRGAALNACGYTAHAINGTTNLTFLEATRPSAPGTSAFRGWIDQSNNHLYLRTGNTDWHFLVNDNEVIRIFNTRNVAIQDQADNATYTDNAAVLLQVNSTTQGVLIPRMTSSQRTAIASPPTGLWVFDTTLGEFCFYNGTAWKSLNSTVIP